MTARTVRFVKVRRANTGLPVEAQLSGLRAVETTAERHW